MTTFKEKIVGAVNYMTNFFVSCYLVHSRIHTENGGHIKLIKPVYSFKINTADPIERQLKEGGKTGGRGG